MKSIPNQLEIKKLLDIQLLIIHAYRMAWMSEFKSKTRKSILDLDFRVNQALYSLKFKNHSLLLSYYYSIQKLEENELKKILKPRKGKMNKVQDSKNKQMKDIELFLSCIKKNIFL